MIGGVAAGRGIPGPRIAGGAEHDEHRARGAAASAPPVATRGHARGNIAAEMIAHDISAEYLSNLTRGYPYRAMTLEQRIGFRRAIAELRHQRDTLAAMVRRALAAKCGPERGDAA